MGLIKEKLLQIALQNIVSNRYQPRENFDENGVKELAASISEVGLLHPPLVRPIFGTSQYEIVSGERRIMACRLLGYAEVPVIVRDHIGHLQSAKAALIENIQRVDLNPLEIARSMKAMIEEFDLSQEELALQIGKKRSTVANYLRLLQLSSPIQEAIFEGKLSMAHAKVLLSCPEKDRKTLFEQIVEKELTVRKAAELSLSFLSKKKEAKAIDPYLKDLANRLQARFGTKVTIENRNGKGNVSLHFYNLDDLDRILELCHAL
jgi:ParB family transcriptional regulator, chromosome partitioning protein